MKPWISIINLGFFSRHAQPLGHGSQRIIYWIHDSRAIKTANHISWKCPCTTLLLKPKSAPVFCFDLWIHPGSVLPWYLFAVFLIFVSSDS